MIQKIYTLSIAFFCVSYVFASIGVFCFGGLIQKGSDNNPHYQALQDSRFAQNGFWGLNFNDFTGAFMTLFCCLHVSDFDVIASGYLAVTSQASRLYFAGWYVIGVLLLLNIVKSFFLADFMGLVERKKQDKVQSSLSQDPTRTDPSHDHDHGAQSPEESTRNNYDHTIEADADDWPLNRLQQSRAQSVSDSTASLMPQSQMWDDGLGVRVDEDKATPNNQKGDLTSPMPSEDVVSCHHSMAENTSYSKAQFIGGSVMEEGAVLEEAKHNDFVDSEYDVNQVEAVDEGGSNGREEDWSLIDLTQTLPVSAAGIGAPVNSDESYLVSTLYCKVIATLTSHHRFSARQYLSYFGFFAFSRI